MYDFIANNWGLLLIGFVFVGLVGWAIVRFVDDEKRNAAALTRLDALAKPEPEPEVFRAQLREIPASGVMPDELSALGRPAFAAKPLVHQSKRKPPVRRKPNSKRK